MITKILQEFDEIANRQIFKLGDKKGTLKNIIVYDSLKSFIISAFIQDVDETIKILEGKMFVNPSEAGQFAMHSDGYNQALEDQIDYLQDKKKELSELSK